MLSKPEYEIIRKWGEETKERFYHLWGKKQQKTLEKIQKLCVGGFTPRTEKTESIPAGRFKKLRRNKND